MGMIEISSNVYMWLTIYNIIAVLVKKNMYQLLICYAIVIYISLLNVQLLL